MMRAGRRLSTCYHEAGHALARWYFGHFTDRAVVLTLKQVSMREWVECRRGVAVETEGFVDGYGIHNPPWGAKHYSNSPELLNSATVSRDQALVGLWAGIVAEAAYRKHGQALCWFSGGSDDSGCLTRILAGWYPDEIERQAADRLAARRAAALVRSSSGSAAIKAMADALMARGEIEGDEIEALCRNAYGGRQPAFMSWDAHWPPTLADIRNGVIHEEELRAAA